MGHGEVLKKLDDLQKDILCLKEKDPCIHYTIALSFLKSIKQWIERKPFKEEK